MTTTTTSTTQTGVEDGRGRPERRDGAAATDVDVLCHATYQLSAGDAPSPPDLEPFPVISWADEDGPFDYDGEYHGGGGSSSSSSSSVLTAVRDHARAVEVWRQNQLLLLLLRRLWGAGPCEARHRLVRCAELYPSLVAFDAADDDDGRQTTAASFFEGKEWTARQLQECWDSRDA